ncbi:MAG TPA: glycosyltransferase family 4 protein [Caldimonas sp.]|nr:glycosyltransferase family 4 protein [Caldimonas sp.]
MSVRPVDQRPRRIVIVSEHASARFGGEAALPLHYFRVLRRLGHDVWLITHARTREELKGLFPGDDRICYIDDTAFHKFMWGISRRLPARIAYFTTGFVSRLSVQRIQRKIVRRLVDEEGVEIVHQPMPVSPREPSALFGLGVPVVIGPMNGGMQYPPAFRREKPLESLLVAGARTVANLLNGVLVGKRRAAVLLVANPRTRDALPRPVAGDVLELVENGVDLSVFSPPADVAHPMPSTERRLPTFLFLGRLVDWKRVDLLLRACARAMEAIPIRLVVVGAGDEEASLRTLAARLGIVATDGASPGVEFAGWLSQRECAGRLAQSDALVLPSILECGGAVVLEAMAMAKPVIATAWGGPLDYLDATCGMLVAPDGEAELVEGLASAMKTLAADPALCRRMGAAGRARVERHFDWDVKVAQVLEIYDRAIEKHAALARAV